MLPWTDQCMSEGTEISPSSGSNGSGNQPLRHYPHSAPVAGVDVPRLPRAERLNCRSFIQQASCLQVFHARQIVKVLKTKLIQKLIAVPQVTGRPGDRRLPRGRIQPASKEHPWFLYSIQRPESPHLRPGDRLMIAIMAKVSTAARDSFGHFPLHD